jgi:teichuronic acid biosynthesis glycosyltransferase TuaC
VRALIVTNMYPTEADPVRGSFVRDQVQALRRQPGVEVEVFTFAPGGASPYPRAARELRRRYQGRDFDIIHAHFGLTAWAALALRGAPHAISLHGSDLVVPRSRAATLAALPWLDLVAPVSEPLAALVPRRLVRGEFAVLPCGVDIERFAPLDRGAARRALGLAADRRYVLFAADPARPEKRVDRARSVLGDMAELLTLGRVAPDRMPLYVNAADAVLVPSERESFGLAVLEALACEVPVLATEVGIAPAVLPGLDGAWCGPFEVERWRGMLAEVLADPDPRLSGGRERAMPYSAAHMAERVLAAWEGVRRRRRG